MTDLKALAERIEAGSAEQQRELIELAWGAVYSFTGSVANPDYDVWRWRMVRAWKMLDAEAYIDAALTLVPERWKLRQMDFSAPCADDRSWHLNLRGGQEGQDRFVGRGKTPALAIAAASLRARITDNADHA